MPEKGIDWTFGSPLASHHTRLIERCTRSTWKTLLGLPEEAYNMLTESTSLEEEYHRGYRFVKMTSEIWRARWPEGYMLNLHHRPRDEPTEKNVYPVRIVSEVKIGQDVA